MRNSTDDEKMIALIINDPIRSAPGARAGSAATTATTWAAMMNTQ
ncbi:hypothetical protein [Azotobacter beijerinckii]|nr:hypothetical protein [Azotobacter beijerinckii]